MDITNPTPTIPITRAEYNRIKRIAKEIERLENEQDKLFRAACLIAGVDSDDTMDSGTVFDYLYNGEKHPFKIVRQITGIGGAA